MAMNLQDWANIAAIVSAMGEVLRTGREQFELFYNRFRSAPDIDDDARKLARAFSTYSDEEVEAILDRIKSCRDRFVREGSGPARQRCFCSVLTDVRDGNGGAIPPIDNWAELYDQLGCDA